MAIIDWNNASLEVGLDWALVQFAGLVRQANAQRFLKAFRSLNSEDRDAINYLMGSNPSVTGHECESLARLIEALPKGTERYSGFAVSRTQPPVIYPTYLFMWFGSRTTNRSVVVKVGAEGEGCSFDLCTGTGNPSHFLEPWCLRIIREAATDVSTALSYYG